MSLAQLQRLQHKSLLTPWEVVKFSPVDSSYPPKKLRDLIKVKEMKFFRDCNMGMEFYRDVLKVELNDYSGLKSWSASETYNLGDRVLWYDQAVESTSNDNSFEPCIEDSDWVEVPKFKKEVLNILWSDYLRGYLSFSIIASSLTYNTYNVGKNGTTKYSEDYRENSTGLITVERGEMYDYKKELMDDANDIKIAMYAFLEETYKLGLAPEFASIKYVQENCIDNCPDPNKYRQGRRWSFLN